MAVRFNFDKDFDDNVYRASNKSGSSLRPLYDQVRDKTDTIARIAEASMKDAAGGAESEVDTIKNSDWESNFGGKGRRGWLYAKAKAFALKSGAQSVAPTMGYDGREIYGRVLINRRGSNTLEFGGPDPVAEIGRGTGEYVEHPPYAFLRNAMRRAV